MALNAQERIFFLGATGYLGSQFLILLAQSQPKFHIVALIRNAAAEAKLKAIYHDLSIVLGTLDDVATIEEEAIRAKYVVNCASSDHSESIKATITGLQKQSAARPGDPPLYLHVSGLGIIHDDAKGELVDEDKIPRYRDTGFSLEQVPVDNPHMNCDKQIVDAGVQTENPIRTIIAYPGWMYGVGEGIQKITAAIRVFLTFSKSIKYAGTWGPGHNSMSQIHVKDAASALLAIFKAALHGKADEGAEGHYFLGTDGPYTPMREITKIMGDIMFSNGLFVQGGTRPLPSEAANLFGEYGRRLMAANQRIDPQRLKRLGWEPIETKRIQLLDSLPQEIQIVVQEQKSIIQA